ncbi:MAG: VWA domain-containing protein [Desulfatibacillaceae bacterium]|nr:VWA domain-containing protein [Desulfatibacillaceae bacterium]
MLGIVTRFAGAARAAGLRVSSSEVLDCTRHLSMIDVLDEAQFRTVLRANFAKSLREQAQFDQLYELFFKQLSTDAQSEAQVLGRALEQALNSLREQAGENALLQAALDMISGEPSAFLALMNDLETDGERPAMAMGGNLGQVARRLEVMLSLNDIRGLAAQFLEQNRSTLPWQVRRDMERHFQARLEMANRLLTQAPRPENAGLVRAMSHEKRMAQLGETPFVSLSPKEVQEMRFVIDHLVRKLKDTVARRYAARTRGILDVKRTLRRAARFQGVPMEIVLKKKPPNKGKIVTLCDVSGSVWSAARFMLNMLYAVQDCFSRVKSFIFVAGLADVTPIFEHNAINQAIERVLRETDLEYGASTDYGATLRDFARNHMDILNKKTTIIIIGDGRSNYCNPEARILDAMREKARRIVWLNPEPPQFWYSGDSEMKTYERYCHEVRPCQNLNQLMEFISDLVL